MDDWQALLDDIEEYLDDHMDVDDGDDGRPVPNRAMSLHTRLTTLRAQAAPGGGGPEWCERARQQEKESQ